MPETSKNQPFTNCIGNWTDTCT